MVAQMSRGLSRSRYSRQSCASVCPVTAKAVQRVLSGLRPASVGLIAAAGFGILKIALNFSPNVGILECVSWKALIVMVVIGVLYRWKQKWHPIIFIALGAVAGLVLGL